MESENLELEQVISAIKLLGFEKVVIYSNLYEASDSNVYDVLARSPAELSVLSKYVPKHRVYLLTPRIPQDAVYISQCISWRNTLNSLTARELQLLIRELGREKLGREKPDEVKVLREDITVVRGVKELEQYLVRGKSAEKVVFEVCPGGCLLGGGQPVSRSNNLTKVLAVRRNIFRKITGYWTT